MPHREYGRLWCSYVSAMAACLLDIRTAGSQGAASRLVSSAAPAADDTVKMASLAAVPTTAGAEQSCPLDHMNSRGSR
jgi:hypothetical protein